MLLENSLKGTIAQYGHAPVKEVMSCLNCEKEVLRRTGVNKKHHKYCSMVCYREYMAARFDRYIASPESLALPQNYDEFLSRDELPCLIEGCGWSGQRLSNHMNLTHGIKKQKFKEMAGFNATTGVCTPDQSRKMSEGRIGIGWGADYMDYLRSLQRRGVVPPDSYEPRLEAKEHMAKARALMVRPEREFLCVGCGGVIKTTALIKKYCTTECRDRHYVRPQKKGGLEK